MSLVIMIEGGLGPERVRDLKRKEDEYQIFWVGVLEAIPRAKSGDPVPYLITAGYGAVKNYRRAENTKQYYKVCPNCGTEYGYRITVCRKCGVETENRVRQIEYLDRHESNFHHAIEERVMLEQFVDGLEGRQRYVAKRWLLDRADIYFDNHIKQIAVELGISAPAVAKYKKQIKRQLMAWYYEEV